jgi:hypothetical protein
MYDERDRRPEFESKCEDPSYSYVNEDAIDEELFCSYICHQPLVDPVAHNTCGISFCRKCIESADYKCPMCRTGTASEYADINVRIVLNQLGRILVKCERCSKEMARGDFEAHKPVCPFSCLHGCSAIISRVKEAEHYKLCTHIEIPCSAATLGCTEVIRRIEIEEHVKNCSWERSRWIVVPLKREIEQLKAIMLDQSDSLYSFTSKQSTNIEWSLVNKIAQTLRDTAQKTNVPRNAMEKGVVGDSPFIPQISFRQYL